ncbi:hypothetical protein [Streptomyces sp. NBC_00057]|uniref:hypothetical protein n=1 Tax=Streptomyces sp. NBC_00057 TaxID=2975634 RepID=UPI00324F3341
MAGTLFAAISPSQVGRILADLDLKPHQVRGWLTRRDTPGFWQRAADICDLFLTPPDGGVVLSIDEKTGRIGAAAGTGGAGGGRRGRGG